MQERKTDVDPAPIIERLHTRLTKYPGHPAPSPGETTSPWIAASAVLTRHQSGSWDAACSAEDIGKMHGLALALLELLKCSADRLHVHVSTAALATCALADSIREWRSRMEPLLEEVNRLNAERGPAAQAAVLDDGSTRRPLFTISDVPDRIARAAALSIEFDALANDLAEQLFAPAKLDHKTGRPPAVEMRTAAEFLADAGFKHRESAELLLGGVTDSHVNQIRMLLRPLSPGENPA